MTIEADLAGGFESYSAEITGTVLTPNAISLDVEAGTGAISYEVACESPPIVCLNGTPVRAVVMYYHLKDIENEPRH